MFTLNTARKQIKWLKQQIECLRKRDCECQDNQTSKLITATTDSPQGDNGANIISQNVQQISAYEEHLEFIDSPESVSNIPGGHSVLKLSDSLVNTINSNLLGDLNFKWGKANPKENPSDFVVNTQIPGKTIRDKNMPVSVYNLLVEVPYWDSIKNYNPILLIDRYKPKSYKGEDNETGEAKFRKSGYKHELVSDAKDNGRVNEIQLQDKNNILYFNQENYFGVLNDRPYTKGFSTMFGQSNRQLWDEWRIGAYVYLGFRLRLKINGNVIETGHLGFLKMQVMGNTITYKVQ